MNSGRPIAYPPKYPKIYPPIYPDIGTFNPASYIKRYDETIISPTLHNGGFETTGTGGTDPFALWIEAPLGTTSVIDETDPAHIRSGSHACKLATDAAGTLTWIYQGNVLKPGGNYRVSFYAKAVSPTYIYITKYQTIFAINISSSTYSLYTFDFAAEDAIFDIYIANASRTVWLDDITVTELNRWHGNVVSLDMTTGGNTELDGSGLNNNGTVTGAKIISAYNGTCRQFDGVDDVITIEGDMMWIGDLTVEAWINPNGWGEADSGIIATNGRFSLSMNKATSGVYVTSDAFTTKVYSANNSITLGQWHHVLVTRKADGTTNIYINGTLSGTADQNSGVTSSALVNTTIGNNIVGNGTFDGKIGATRIYNRILTANEIRDNYNMDCSRYGLPVRL